MVTRNIMLLGLLIMGCSSPKNEYTPNPAAPGFKVDASDKKAIEIADQVMAAQGGRAAYDAIRYLSWNFFGKRELLWDKYTGNVRINWVDKPQKILVDIQTGTGKVWLGGVEQTNPDTLSKYLQIGKEVWINDSYWLVMPFKLKDSGVTLKYIGEGKTVAGLESDILQMTFEGVGVTPNNKYHIWVSKKDHLVRQWAFFEKFTDENPRFTTPWDDYKKAAPIPVLFSGSRGEKRSMEPVLTPEQASLN